ncbi:MAG: C4-dicarboxylate ABC transporter substrate-binding protein [Burkholderiales bacterium]|nr:C4-dicarboxylate ABC transporter substrate-binding protein [Burkholderiales bacterium]
MRPIRRKLKPLSEFSARDAAAIGLPALALVAAAFWFAYQFVKPAPPARLVMASGPADGAYHPIALRYREILARQHIDLEIRTSAGAVENLRRLADPESAVEAGLVQAGLGDAADYPGIETLGSIYYEPVWIFYRGAPLEDDLRHLRGKRIAVGVEGSGTRRLATQLLLVNGAWTPPTRIVDLGGEAAAQALRKGTIDVALLVGPAEQATIRSLLLDGRVRLMSFDRAAAYTKAFPFLTAVRLPEGGINLLRNIPPNEVVLLAPTANLMVKQTLHPALAGLLLQAMSEVHAGAGILHRDGEFPALRGTEFPASAEAQRYFRSGPPFLQRFLPFWAANLIDRILVLLVPLVAVLIPVLRYAPSLYGWRIRSRIYRWYGELKLLELELKEHFEAQRLPEYRRRLDQLEQRAYTRPLPIAFTPDVYTLRLHIATVRGMLDRGAHASAEAAPASSGADAGPG